VSYIALARKWRPKNFSELVGQTHVMQALSNALDQGRLHHAYLFTGTRGVGKTTIARIFSKALNCEQGISSNPCGVCSTCRSIDEGRFVDLIEVDAASRTKVEDTREILDNVQYAPTQGRYKVYLIDEVHMLSKSSFNALLKTLEEPPEHVKFLLATTDPHKLPVTVLSRCLQFNLMRLTVPQIQQHLAYILQQEQIPFEEAALAMIAKSADGSARDSLSLLDQAIAYGGGEVKTEAVQAMLGLVSQATLTQILQVLAERAPQQVSELMADLSLRGVNYEHLLAELIEALYEISRCQVLGQCSTEAQQQILQDVAQQISPQRVQMLYQMAILARQDLKWAPDARIGFEMALLRMVAFELSELTAIQENSEHFSAESTKIPSPAPQVEEPSDLGQGRKPPSPESAPLEQVSKPEVLPGMEAMQHLQAMRAQLKGQGQAAEQAVGQAIEQASEPREELERVKSEEAEVPPGKSFEPPSSKAFETEQVVQAEKNTESQVEGVVEPESQAGPSALSEAEKAASLTELCQSLQPQPVEQWMALVESASIDGMAAELARQSFLLKLDIEQQQLVLAVHPQQQAAKTPLAETRLIEGMQAYLKQAYGMDFQVAFCEGLNEATAAEVMTPAQWQQHQQQNRLAEAKQAFLQDPFVQQFQQLFGAKVIESSIQPK